MWVRRRLEGVGHFPRRSGRWAGGEAFFALGCGDDDLGAESSTCVISGSAGCSEDSPGGKS